MTNTGSTTDSAVLLMHCPDRKGLVASVTQFIYQHQGNILELDQHVDAEDQRFFMRIEWDLQGFQLSREQIGSRFHESLGKPYHMEWSLHFSDEIPRMAIFVSKLSHCLFDLLSRWQSDEWRVDIPIIISNHRDLEPVASQFGVDYYTLPISKENKREQEKRELELLEEYQIDFIVLARYMQILTGDFIDHYPDRIINIHHSFLPAFPGARPYHSAHERGVKIIGATSHYATEDLDAGPIIEQDVVHVSHKQAVQDLIRKGRDLEKIVLARAVWAHTRRKILVYKNRTIVFG